MPQYVVNILQVYSYDLVHTKGLMGSDIEVEELIYVGCDIVL